MSILVEGVEAVLAFFADLGMSTGEQIAEAVNAAAETCISGARANAPMRTGYLRDSIVVADSDLNPDASLIYADVAASAEYAPFIEFGHHARDHATWVPAQPFMEPAFGKAAEQFLSDCDGVKL